jgi:hypothetical protein
MLALVHKTIGMSEIDVSVFNVLNGAQRLNGLNNLNLSPFYDVIDTFSRRRYFFRKRLRVIAFGTAQAMEPLELVLRL